MSEDRQKILEQKRQRLLELQQKRAALEAARSKASEHHEVPAAPQKIDASTQTDLTVTYSGGNTGGEDLDFAIRVGSTAVSESELLENKAKKSDQRQELTHFDKAVQTTDLDLEEENILEADSKLKNGTKTGSAELSEDKSFKVLNVSEYELNRAIIESIKTINKVQITRSIDLEPVLSRTNFEKSEFIIGTHTFSLERNIQCFDVSPHNPNQIVVGFERSMEYMYSAVLYEIQENTILVPLLYFVSISEITMLKFDTNKEGRIIGALANGAVAVWEVDDYALMLDPALITHYSVFTIGSDEELWFPHRRKIVMMEQIRVDQNDCVVTLSEEGVLNLWSTKILSQPRFSRRLLDENTLRSGLLVDHGVYTGPKDVVGEFEAKLKMVIAANNGKLYNEQWKLIHEPMEDNSLFVKTLNNFGSADIGVGTRNDGESSKSSTISSSGGGGGVVVSGYDGHGGYGGNGYIISSHLDWHLRIWKDYKQEALFTVPTDYVIEKIAQRPQYPYQFVAVGCFVDEYVITYWDLERRLYNPIRTLFENVEDVESVIFNGPWELFLCRKNKVQSIKLNKNFKLSTKRRKDEDRGKGYENENNQEKANEVDDVEEDPFDRGLLEEMKKVNNLNNFQARLN